MVDERTAASSSMSFENWSRAARRLAPTRPASLPCWMRAARAASWAAYAASYGSNEGSPNSIGLRAAVVERGALVGDVGHAGNSKAALMADGAEVCGCNGVSKGAIVKAIKEKGLFTLDEVKKHTKAASSCGSCAGLVEQILASTIGGAYAPAASDKKKE